MERDAGADELTSVTAHWLLGRVSVLGGIVAHLANADELDDDQRAELGVRGRMICDQMRSSLEGMVRGTLTTPPPTSEAEARGISPPG